MAGLIDSLKALGPLRLLALAAVGVATLGLVAMVAMRASETPMVPLFVELESRDAAAVVAALERARMPHRLGNGGAQVLVAPEDVPRARLLLAKDGLPSGGGIGWEIFDRGEQLTTTPFQQDINRLRALEGELARTIRGLAGVRHARVHLVLPRREPFSRERADAQASIVLTMQGAQRLDREGVQAVLHLVATAVPGLRPQNVSIVDSRGELLARGGQALAGPAAAQTQDELRRAQELRLARAVEELLERSLGPGRVRAEATVEFDFDRVQTTEERFDPDNQVPRSQQSSSESSRSGEPAPTSVATNLPGADNPGGPTNQESRQEETTNFEIGKTTRNTLREHPVIRRVSIAVLVDGVAEPQGEGPPQVRERTAEELGRLAALVRAAAGLDERRGDRVEVVSMRFVAPETTETPAPGLVDMLLTPTNITRLAESGLLALVVLAALLLVGRPMVKRITATLVPAAALAGPGMEGAAALAGPGGGTASLPATNPDGTPALPGAEGLTALPSNEDDMVQLAHVQGQMRASSIQQLLRLVEAYPDQSLAVLRRWLDPDDGL